MNNSKLVGLLILVLILGIAVGYQVRTPSQIVRTEQRTQTSIIVVTQLESLASQTTEGAKLVRIGETFTVPMAEGGKVVPVEVTFTKAFTTMEVTHAFFPSNMTTTADMNYVYFVVEFTVRNVGKETTVAFTSCWSEVGCYNDWWKLTVDRGYIYDKNDYLSDQSFSLRPEEVGHGRVVFEILATTTPIEMTINSPWDGRPVIILRFV
jgi:hypothetical protein